MSDRGNAQCCDPTVRTRLATRGQVGLHRCLDLPHRRARSRPMGLGLQELQVAEAVDDLFRHLLPIVDASNDLRLEARRRPHLPLRPHRHLLQLSLRLAQHHLHHHRAHVQQGTNAGIWAKGVSAPPRL